MKRSTLSSHFRSLVLTGLAAVAGMAPGYHAFAQSAATMHDVADVPFDFRSGTHLMPAGRYEITKLSDHVILLRGTDDSRTQAICIFDTFAFTAPENSKIVFHKYGNKYFLHQVWTAGKNAGVQLPKGHAEQELLRAKADSVPMTTELALNREPLR